VGLFDNLFKAKPDAADEAVVEAAKRIAEHEKARLLEASRVPPAAPAARSGIVPTAKPAPIVPAPRAYSPRTLGQVVPPSRPSRSGETTARKIRFSSQEETTRPNEVVLTVEDVLSRIPMELLTDGPHDLSRELRFKVEDLSADIARGRAAVSLGSIAVQVPELFREPIARNDARQIRLPLQKLVEQIGFLPIKPPAPASTPPAAAAAPAPPLPPPPGPGPTMPAEAVAPPPAFEPSPSPAPAPDVDSTSPSLRISLSLVAVLKTCPRDLIVADLPSIGEGERITFAWPAIEKQLQSGGPVEVSSVRFIFALPAYLHGYFEAREGIRVPLPLDEIRRNMPGGAGVSVNESDILFAEENVAAPVAPLETPALAPAEPPRSELPQPAFTNTSAPSAYDDESIPVVVFARKKPAPQPDVPPMPVEPAALFETAPVPVAPPVLPAVPAEPALVLEPPPVIEPAAVVEPPPLIEPAVAEPEAVIEPALPVLPIEEPVVAPPVFVPPVVEELRAEVPVTEPPVVDPPVLEAELVEPPPVIPPVIEELRAEIPVTEPPVIEPPVAEAPPVELPVVEIPEAEVPAVQIPVVEPPVLHTEIEARPLDLPPPLVAHAPPPLSVEPVLESEPHSVPPIPPISEIEAPAEPTTLSEPAAASEPVVPPIFVPPPLRQAGETVAPLAPEPTEVPLAPPNVWMQPPAELAARATPHWPPDVAPPPSPILPVRIIAPPVARPIVAPPPLFSGTTVDIPAPVAIPAPEPPPPPPPLNLEAACAALGVPGEATLADLGATLLRLPGLSACHLIVRHESASVGELPASFDAVAVGVLSRQLSTALDSSAESLAVGRVQHMTIFADDACVSFFTQGEATVCAIHRTRAFLPGVRERLASAAAALAQA